MSKNPSPPKKKVQIEEGKLHHRQDEFQSNFREKCNLWQYFKSLDNIFLKIFS